MPEANGNHPVTRTELNADLHALEDRLITAIARSQAEIVEHMHEFVRDAQTELLRGFEAFSIGHNAQTRKLQADLSNVDASANLRLLAVENRLLQIEKRLPLLPPEQ